MNIHIGHHGVIDSWKWILLYFTLFKTKIVRLVFYLEENCYQFWSHCLKIYLLNMSISSTKVDDKILEAVPIDLM